MALDALRVTFFLVATACSASGTEPGIVEATTPPVQDAGAAAHAFDQTHARWNAILKAHVVGDRFDYAAVKADPKELYAYLTELRGVTPDELASWTREQRFAFWINAYNAFTVAKVVENLPLKSIRDLDKDLGLKTVFEQAWIPLQQLDPSGKGALLSLNDIEHEILRKRFQDARVHAAINCASISCPPLASEAFVADRLDEQLDHQMRVFVADRERNRLDEKAGVAYLSKIFDWFASDFERDAGSVRAWLLRYAPEKDHAFLEKAKLRFQDYDWKLNAVPHEEKAGG